VDRTPPRHHSLKAKSFALYQACCLGGRFPSSVFSSDFVKLAAVPHARAGDAWADVELPHSFLKAVGASGSSSRFRMRIPTRPPKVLRARFATRRACPFCPADNPAISVVAIPAGVLRLVIAADAAKIFLHELSKPEAGEADVDMAMQQQDVSHAQIVRAAPIALKSFAKATGTLAKAEDAHVRSALGSLVTLQKLELKRRFQEVEEVLEDERRRLEMARLSLVGERVALCHALNICAGPVELHWLTVEAGA
jgi:SWI/SNF related-matrix-associated actin-dependent regulator of chromatin subfamily C